MSLNFVAVDFETANNHRGSACAVGAVRIRDGKVVDSFSSLIKPHDEVADFLPMNTSIHGLDSSSVREASEWPVVFPELMAFIGTDIVVGHNADFDISVLLNACSLYDLDWPSLEAVCSLRISRASLRLATYSLPWVVDHLGLPDFDHHDPVADARASALVTVELASRAGVSELRSLATAVGVRVEPTVEDEEALLVDTLGSEADPIIGGGFEGESVCFTGALKSMVRGEAQRLVVEHGGKVDKSVLLRTTMLVTGDYDRLSFQPTTVLTSKLRRAFELAEKGQRIEVVTEDDFISRLSLNEEQLRKRLVANRTGRSRAPAWVIEQAGSGPGDGDFWPWYRAALAHPDGRAVGGEPCIWCSEPVPAKTHWTHRDRHVCGIHCNERFKRSSVAAWRRAGISL